MNWQAMGAVGELLGGVVVLASLVFLAMQIRRNTQALRMSAAEESNRSFASYAGASTALPRVGSPSKPRDTRRVARTGSATLRG
jgi:hypothetical protein